jgi:predicted phosphohydrolase
MELTRKNFVRIPTLPEDKETVLILAGDIGTWKQATSWMIDIKEQFAHIVYVAGNHEYYGQEVALMQRHTRQRFKEHDNLHYLENDSLELDDCVIVGATLWTDIGDYDPEAIVICGKYMNDYKCINIGTPEDKRLLHPNDTIAIHKQSLACFERVIESATKPVVIITHHAPSFGTVTDEDIGPFDDRIQCAYATNLYDWLNERKHKVAVWCHGHTHKSMIYSLAGVPVLTNAKGYHNEKTGFKADFTFSLSNSVISYDGKE